MTKKGEKGNNFNPIGIFDWCTSRDQVVDYSINLAKQVFIKKGYRIFIPDNPDTGGDKEKILAINFIKKGGSCVFEITFKASDLAIFLANFNNIIIFFIIKFSTQSE